jgi:Family of unknown function (DUF5995)
MVRRRDVCALAVAVVALGGGAVGWAPAQAPGVPWTEFLPALPSPPQTHPNRVAHCKRATIRCVDFQIARMRALRDRLGCDHKAVFATTYLELTKVLRDAVAGDPGFFRFPRFFFREDALFANVYFRTVRAWERGEVEKVPRAWEIAFETAETGEVTGAQDMLLGINAHVQNDMPFVLAQLQLRDRRGASRKPDHDKANRNLSAGYGPVVRAVGERYDPNMSLTNPPGVPVDDVAGLEIVREWRERVWRNAERLVNAQSEEERAAVAADIQAYSAQWAEGIAATPFPGARESRDAYCARQLGG